MFWHFTEKNDLFLVGASQASDGAKVNAESASAGPVAETFRVIQGELNKEIVKSTQGVFQFELSGKTITCKILKRSLF